MFVLFLSATFLAPQVTSSAITPEMVEQMIERHGAKRAVSELTKAARKDPRAEDLGDYEKVLDGIASGDARWLALVPRLEPGTDAATAETLRIVVALALPKNPAEVLGLITRQPSWRDACSYPMIEPTDEEVQAYFNAAIPAVKSVHNPALQRARNECLADLTKAQRTP